ncbi:hypothetical protein FQN60_007272, partial [Etheostoma spectabile]
MPYLHEQLELKQRLKLCSIVLLLLQISHRIMLLLSLSNSVSNPNNTFDVSIDPGSVKVVGKRSNSNYSTYNCFIHNCCIYNGRTFNYLSTTAVIFNNCTVNCCIYTAVSTTAALTIA